MKFKKIKKLFAKISEELQGENIPIRASALSYSLLFSAVPIIYFLIVGASFLGDKIPLLTNTVLNLNTVLNESAFDFFAAGVSGTRAGKWAFGYEIIGVLVLIFAASNYFVRLGGIFREIFDLDESASILSGIFVRRVLGILYVMIITSFVVLSLFASLLASYAGVFSESLFRNSLAFGIVIQNLFVFVILSAIITMMYRMLSQHIIPWRVSFKTGILVSALLAIVNSLLNIYFAYAHVGTAYGAAGTVFVVLVWFYFLHLVFLGGALLARSEIR